MLNTINHNHIWKQLKKLLQEHSISYQVINSQVAVRGKCFKPILIKFESDYITVTPITEKSFTVSFRAATINELLTKLIKFRFVSTISLLNLIN